MRDDIKREMRDATRHEPFVRGGLSRLVKVLPFVPETQRPLASRPTRARLQHSLDAQIVKNEPSRWSVPNYSASITNFGIEGLEWLWDRRLFGSPQLSVGFLQRSHYASASRGSLVAGHLSSTIRYPGT